MYLLGVAEEAPFGERKVLSGPRSREVVEATGPLATLLRLKDSLANREAGEALALNEPLNNDKTAPIEIPPATVGIPL